MNWLVTGGTGFLGANVIRALLARGDGVRCVVRTPNLCIEGLPVEIVDARFDDRAALIAAARGCAGIFHVAGTFDPSTGGIERMQDIHVHAARMFVGVAREVGCRFLYCSSSITVGFGSKEAPGDEDTPLDPDRIYGRSGPLRAYYDTKLEGERITIGAGGVVVNPDYVLGPWDVKPTSGQLLLSVAAGRVPVHPRGGKCFVDAGDCAVGHLAALDRGIPGRRYLLGNHNLSYAEFIAACAAASGRRASVLPVPSVLLSAAGHAGSLLQRVDAHRFAGLDRHVLLAMQEGRYRTGRRANEELGMPRTPITTTIRSALEWFTEFGYVRRP